MGTSGGIERGVGGKPGMEDGVDGFSPDRRQGNIVLPDGTRAAEVMQALAVIEREAPAMRVAGELLAQRRAYVRIAF